MARRMTVTASTPRWSVCYPASMSDDFEFLDYAPEGDALREATEIIHAERSQWEKRGVAEEDLAVWFLQGVTGNPDPTFWHPLSDGVLVAVAPRQRAAAVLEQLRNAASAAPASAAIRALGEPAARGGMHALWSLAGRGIKFGSVVVDRDGASLRRRDDVN